MTAALRPEVQSVHDLIMELEARGCRVRGRNATCPWHDDKTPSASLYEESGHWRIRCHVCARSADAIDLLAEAARITPEDWMRSHPTQDKPRPTAAPRSEAAPRRWPTVESWTAAVAQAAGAEVAAIHRYEVPGRDLPALVVLRLFTGSAAPITGKRPKTIRQGHHDGSGWVSTAPPKPWPLYRLPDLGIAKSIVVTEGEAKTDALRDLGITATTAPGGAGKAEHADWSPLAGKRIVLWPDHDDAGRKHMDQVVEILRALPSPPQSIARIDPAALDLPPKGDAVDFLARVSPDADSRDAVLAVLRAAPAVGEVGPAAALAALVEDEIAGRSKLIPWPWPVLTRTTRALLPGKVAILAGSPGGAKSWFVLACMLDLLRREVPAAMLALEEGREWHLKRALAILAGDPHLLAGEWCQANPDDARDALAQHAAVIDRLGRCYTCKGNLGLGSVAGWVEAQCKAGARVLFIDPISLADPEGAKPWEADRAFMARVKVAIETAGTSLVLVTHPRKGPSGPKPTMPGMDDLAGGAAYSRAAACVLWLANLPEVKRMLVRTAEPAEESAEVHKTVGVLKTRDATGSGSTIGFRFERLQFIEAGLVVRALP